MDSVFLILNIVLGVILVLIVLVLLAPRLFPKVQPKLQQMAMNTYQKRFFKQIKKKFPLLAERLEQFEMSPENQAAFQATMQKLPPQEGMKLQLEFNRLRDKFMERHPEVAPLIAQAQSQDAKAQSKALDQVMKLPDDQRAAIEKDLLWAWDQLRGRFPKMMGQLEAPLKKKTPAAK